MKANVKSGVAGALLLRYDIGSVIWDNTGRGNEEAGWSDQSEARIGSVLANQKPEEAMMRLPHCNEHSDIEPMSTATVKSVLYLFIYFCVPRLLLF